MAESYISEGLRGDRSPPIRIKKPTHQTQSSAQPSHKNTQYLNSSPGEWRAMTSGEGGKRARGGRGHAAMVGQGAGRGNGKDQHTDQPRSTSDIFAYGLLLVGFGEDRQKCSKQLSLQRFQAHFGVDPKTIKKNSSIS